MSLPPGDGSDLAARRIYSDLAKLRDGGGLSAPPPGYYRFDFSDGSWCIASGTDSHHALDGGTVGFLGGDGQIGVFYTHVCGPGPASVESLCGKNVTETFARLRASGAKEWLPINR